MLNQEFILLLMKVFKIEENELTEYAFGVNEEGVSYNLIKQAKENLDEKEFYKFRLMLKSWFLAMELAKAIGESEDNNNVNN